MTVVIGASVKKYRITFEELRPVYRGSTVTEEPEETWVVTEESMSTDQKVMAGTLRAIAIRLSQD